MKLVNRLIEIEPSKSLIILNTLMRSGKWLGVKELMRIVDFKHINKHIKTFYSLGMITERLEPYSCNRKVRKLWTINWENKLIKILNQEI